MADFLSPEVRSRVMSKIRSKDTKPEKMIELLLNSEGLTFSKHVFNLPGKPDFVLYKEQVIIFVDGDFWHGWRFPKWEDKLEKGYWHAKIASNRQRDKKNHARLRRLGWTVIRVWEHQLKNCPEKVTKRILTKCAKKK